ncbi:apical endosomal glycoprotein [Denticeps clupeoides]|uniref:apical endosomal glycoprotein n=1 Tax=Denticeps clupeoides TaxID=299321 RepID=UPI0010A56C5D|nr:apical endosomal glycoprotein-like [Denticeps clupeoides]
MGRILRLVIVCVLLQLQLAIGQERYEYVTEHGRLECVVTQEQKCNFVCDCSDCRDERDCGYKGQGFICDFEDASVCGWTDVSSQSIYTWKQMQSGQTHTHTLPSSGPSCDYTTGSSTGRFMGVTNVTAESPHSAVLKSPLMQQSAATCRLIIRYFLWDSGNTGFGDVPLWASVWRENSTHSVVWRPEATSVRSWREAVVFLGRTNTPFYIQLHSTRSVGSYGDVAVDQLEFRDCALPVSAGGCDTGFFNCTQGNCVMQQQVCDGTDDCGDGSDELMCDGYWRCDFEEGLCMWDLKIMSPLKWNRTLQTNLTTSDHRIGPGRDHSENTASGHFLYLTTSENTTADWSAFHSPLLQPTTPEHPCEMVMYTHQFGPRSGGVSVLVAEHQIYPVWERGGALGDLWVRAKVEFVVNSTFQILFVGAVRDGAYGGIGIDSIIMSPGCRFSNETAPKPAHPEPPSHPCTDETELLCDFHPDCSGAEDEGACGDFSYAWGSSGWTDSSVGSQGWKLLQNTSAEESLFVSTADGQQLTEAQTRTPLLGPSGVSCSLSFSYSLSGTSPNIGELSLRVIDSMLGPQPRLWEFSGRSSEKPGEWSKQDVYIGERRHRFQLEFSALATEISSSSQIAVKDVRYINCHPSYSPDILNGLFCNFEEELCGWYQDQTDNYDWKLVADGDHTTGSGSSLVVEMWTATLLGPYGRLVSFRHPFTPSPLCLSFYYRMYGPDTGTLNVKVLYPDGPEQLLWTRSGGHGNRWHESLCTISPQLTAFQLVFEAVRSGFDGLVAIDDLALVPGACSVPSSCSFEAQSCGYASTGSTLWVRQRAVSGTGPKTDHTLETENGHYMLAHTGEDFLPQGSTSILTSSVHPPNPNTGCVSFWYSMDVVTPGSLTAFIKPQSGERTKVFSNVLKQSGTWHHGSANISCSESCQIEFEVKGGGGIGSYIAIDDVSFSAHSCPSPGALCDLEHRPCGWYNTPNSSLDQLDWEVTSAAIEKHYPTPPHDHTLGTEKGHFLFLPSSQQNTSLFSACLLSPVLPPTYQTCLRFWVYIPAHYDGELRVLSLVVGTQERLLTVSGGKSEWKRYELNITCTQEYQVVFEGVKGSEGVLALDDIELREGMFCTHSDLPASPHSPDNTAAIAASIAVVVLLIALVVVLVFYLRGRVWASDSAQRMSFSDFGNDTFDPELTQDCVNVPPRNMSEVDLSDDSY